MTDIVGLNETLKLPSFFRILLLSASLFCGLFTLHSGNAAEHSWQKGIIRDAHNNIIGHVDAGGRLYNKNGERYGSIDSDGAVRDKFGQLVGDITINGLIELNGTPVGHIDPDGTVRAINGKKMGIITSQGNVFEANPERFLGRVPSEDKALGALMILRAKETGRQI